ncbi:MAG: polyphosphate polymerase domain-containing protein [Lachnospiraceae bacterium]|nr:polyphosphate polymerase domain-containing protein [Lachnospiraceae bacterium]
MMYRREDKYHLGAQEMDLLEARVRLFFGKDPHAGDSGSYHVSSLYFDDHQDRCFHEALRGEAFRRKYRIRIYENSFKEAKLEIKEKLYQGTKKISSPMEKNEIKALIGGEIFGLNADDEARRIFYLDYETGILRPSVIVSYDRSAYIYEPGNVRITFDRNITASSDFERFGKKKMIRSALDGSGVLEVKYDEFLPEFAARLLETGNMLRVSNSKYVLCRIALDKKERISL